MMTVAYLDIRPEQMPHGSAITRIAQQLGGAFGTPLIAVVLTTAATRTNPDAGYAAAFWWTTAITGAAIRLSLLLPARNESLQRRFGGSAGVGCGPDVLPLPCQGGDRFVGVEPAGIG